MKSRGQRDFWPESARRRLDNVKKSNKEPLISGFVFFSENLSYFWVISFMWVLLYDFRKSQPPPIVLKNTILLVNPHYPIKFKELNFTYTRAKLIQEP